MKPVVPPDVVTGLGNAIRELLLPHRRRLEHSSKRSVTRFLPPDGAVCADRTRRSSAATRMKLTAEACAKLLNLRGLWEWVDNRAIDHSLQRVFCRANLARSRSITSAAVCAIKSTSIRSRAVGSRGSR